MQQAVALFLAQLQIDAHLGRIDVGALDHVVVAGVGVLGGKSPTLEVDVVFERRSLVDLAVEVGVVEPSRLVVILHALAPTHPVGIEVVLLDHRTGDAGAVAGDRRGTYLPPPASSTLTQEEKALEQQKNQRI